MSIYVYMSDNGLISKIYKQLVQINVKKKLIKKWPEDLNRYFPKEDNKTHEKMLIKTSLIIREMQMYIVYICHALLPSRLGVHICSLCLCLYFCFANNIIYIIFSLDSTCTCQCMIFVFLFLTYFTLFDSF